MDDRVLRLERRLGRAEREVRALRALFVVALTGAVALALQRPAATQGNAATVKAPFRIVDGQGRAIVMVDADPGEGRTLRLLDAQGRLLAHLEESGAGGGEFSVYGETGQASAGLMAQTDGARLNLFAKAGKNPDVALVAGKAGGGITVLDRNGKPLLQKPESAAPRRP